MPRKSARKKQRKSQGTETPAVTNLAVNAPEVSSDLRPHANDPSRAEPTTATADERESCPELVVVDESCPSRSASAAQPQAQEHEAAKVEHSARLSARVSRFREEFAWPSLSEAAVLQLGSVVSDRNPVGSGISTNPKVSAEEDLAEGWVLVDHDLELSEQKRTRTRKA